MRFLWTLSLVREEEEDPKCMLQPNIRTSFQHFRYILLFMVMQCNLKSIKFYKSTYTVTVSPKRKTQNKGIDKGVQNKGTDETLC